MGQQGGVIHQQRLGMGQVGSQLVQNGEAVRIEVTPVVHATRLQPRGTGQDFKTIPCAKNDQAVRDRGKRQKIDFIFGDEDMTHRRVQPLKISLSQRDVLRARLWQQRYVGVQHAKTNAQRLVSKAVTAAKPSQPTGTGVNRLRRQAQVQQFCQHPPMRLEKLAVHARQVDLAQIEARARVGLQPRHHGQQSLPLIRQGQRRKGSLF